MERWPHLAETSKSDGEMKSSKTESGIPSWQSRLFLAMVVVGAVAGFYFYQVRQEADLDGPGKGGDSDKQQVAQDLPQMTPQKCLEAIQLKDTSIGHLENGPLEVAVGDKTVSGLILAANGFTELRELLPNEELPWRDLAIARLLLLQNSPQSTKELQQQALQAVQELIEFDPDSIVGRWLRAKVVLHLDASDPLGASQEARQQAVDSLKEATELDPDNATLWLALYQSASDPGSRTPNDQARDALKAAYAAAPRNLYLITEWLMVQATLQDPGIVETLSQSREVLLPLAANIQQRARLDIGATVDQAIAAVKEENWRIVPGLIRRIQFTVRPEEAAKTDLTRVDVHPLEFLLYDFSSEFQQHCALPAKKVSTDTNVTLAIDDDQLLNDAADVQALTVVDIDLNGRPDLVLLQPGALRVLSNSGNPGPDGGEQQWTEMLSIEMPKAMSGILAADLDRDRSATPAAGSRGGGRAPAPAQAAGDPAEFDRVVAEGTSCYEADSDLVVYGADGVIVLENAVDAASGQQALTPVKQTDLGELRDVHAGMMVDFDHDGDLDLVFSSADGISLWRGIGSLQFRNVTEWSILPPPERAPMAMVAVDWDRDVDVDILLGGPNGAPVGYLENLLHGQFRWVAFDEDYEPLSHASDLSVLDAVGNVSWDVLAAGDQGVQLLSTATPKSGIVHLVGVRQLTEQAQLGIFCWDFDNDGLRDAAAWGETGLTVFRGGERGTFVETDLHAGQANQPVRMAVPADLDRDGDEDVAVVFSDHVSLLMNEGGNANNWIAITPMGRADNRGRCNQNAIGSLVELRHNGHYQAQVVKQGPVHFGLGPDGSVDLLRIVWTNGIPQDIVQPKGNIAICEKMTLKGSCPYVYTMVDGQFEFLTDCLWAAPLGLVTSTGDVMPTRAWEYLRIPGDRLTPHEGSYWIQLTEELWEAGYFDFVELIAVDHPAGTDIYSNEKVGPAEIAAFQIHTVREPRQPISARDSQGRDVLKQLQRRDGDFVKAFDVRFQQGLTEEHYVELDLGPLKSPKQITLFLTGWIFPTDTSLNVAFLQDPDVDGPFMPSIWTVDAQGEWRESIPFMGFPGGKTKTIAVDLSQAFSTDDYRLRIKTTAEIYWDEAFFTVDETPVELRQTVCPLKSAALQYRGCSEALPYQANAPQVYDHGRTITKRMWPPMRGKFTRYGSVVDLLSEPDDMMAVLGAGDALTVRFEVPEDPPPAGWKRDFLLHSVGWDKDADLNTIYGQTVGPLPFRAMTQYPYGPDEAVPDSAAYRAYLRKYQTREQHPASFWRHVLTAQ
jgi:tetratricopeptide (TPR) repeat protein